jgi:isoleucyl-tRNA synthetase
LSGEVLDCWFESGSMPYAANHYPFENKEKFEKNFPCDFIAEGIDQTRGWFNSLLILSCALFDESAMKNVVVNGTVLAENGQKMSKRLKNYPDPLDIIKAYGADAMRLYLVGSPAVKAEDLKFSEKEVEEIVKKIVLTLWNSYSFFTTYASIDKFIPTGKVETKNNLDYWIISETNQLTKDVTKSLEKYDLSKSVRLLSDFIDNLSNWYIRRSRRRFWKSENDTDKLQAYETLYCVLNTYIKLLAPFMPFITEEIYQNIAVSVNKNAKLSIHLTDWPKFDEEKIDTKVNDTMGLVRRIVTHGLSIRAGKNIKVRQPLSDIYVYYSGSLELSQDLIMAIKDELNVKNLVLKKDISEDTFVKKEFKIDFSLLGPKYGKKVKEIADAINNGNYESKSGFYSVLGEKLLEEEIKTTFKPKNDKFEVAGDEKVTVAFNIEITEDLRKEGLARDIIRIIQDMRKKANLNVEERIELFFDTENNEISSILLDEWSRYISKEILANKITHSIKNNSEYNEEVSLSSSKVCFGIKKIG